MAIQTQAEKVTFGQFEVDLQTGELWRGSRRIRCQPQPFRTLCALLERPGELVSREELQQVIWGADTPADLDHSLGIAINKLRDALGDSAENPRFVETLSRRGYRFVAPVAVTLKKENGALRPELEAEAEAGGDPGVREGEAAAGSLAGTAGVAAAPMVSPAAPVVSAAAPVVSPAGPVGARWRLAALALVLLGGGAGFLLAHVDGPRRTEPVRVGQITDNDSIFPGVPSMESFPVIASDGGRLYSSILDNGATEIASIDPESGAMQPLVLPTELVNPTLSDISPDGARLLVRSHPSSNSEQPLWIVPRDGGSALRVGNVLAHDAVWMPDGESVLYATGDELDVVRPADGSTSRFAKLPGRGFRMRWSPDGRLLRLTLLDPLSHTSALWQIANGGRPAPLLAGWTSPASECCGVWTSDGKYFVFQSSHEAGSDLWVLRGEHGGSPEKLTNGPLFYTAPAAEHGTHRVYFVGLDTRSQLQRFDGALGRFVQETGFLSGAMRASESPDRQWVVWTDGAGGHLWRARARDGSEKVQLTTGTLQVFLAQWSPDSRQLMMMARKPGKSWQLFLMSADGGLAEPVLREKRNEADPTWSPDGREIAFGRTSDLMGREEGPKEIEVLNLATHTVTALPGSEGLFSPRWSPDGRWIAALTLGEQRLMVYDTEKRVWRKVRGDLRAADPVWAPDGSGLYIHEAFSNPQTIDRISIPNDAITRIASLTGPLVSGKEDYVFVGLTRDDAPLVRVRTATGNLYTLALGR